MFKPILFEEVTGIVGKISLRQVVTSMCERDYIFIQDTDDMIIEKWFVSDLKIIQDKGVSFYGFNITEDLEIVVFDSIFVSRHLDYLNGLLTFREYRESRKEIFNIDILQSYGVKIRYGINLLSLSINRLITGEFFLFLNDKCLIQLGINSLVLKTYSNIVRTFKIVQVCKTKVGFEIVLFIPISLIFLGLCVSYTLDLISVVNIPKEPDLLSVTHEDYKSIVSKSKLII